MIYQQINSEVQCINEWATDCPTYAEGTINADLKLRIRSLARAAMELHVDHIALFDYTMTWFESNGTEFRVECPQLVVQSDVFWWEAIPKGCGDDMLLRTERMPIAGLVGPNHEKPAPHWVLFDTNSKEPIPFGEEVETPDGKRYTFINGQVPEHGIAASVITWSENGDIFVFPTTTVDAEWKAFETEEDLQEYWGLEWVDYVEYLPK